MSGLKWFLWIFFLGAVDIFESLWGSRQAWVSAGKMFVLKSFL